MNNYNAWETNLFVRKVPLTNLSNFFAEGKFRSEYGRVISDTKLDCCERAPLNANNPCIYISYF